MTLPTEISVRLSLVRPRFHMLPLASCLGSYNKDAKEIFEFVKELLAQGKRRTSALNLDTLYNCLNRTILFELSGKTDSVPRRTAVLDSLHRLTNSRSLVFGPGNYELEFVGCLTHCLLELCSDRHEVSCEDSNTQWHVAQPVYSRSESMDEGFQLLVTAANRVWQELYVHKKPVSRIRMKSFCYPYHLSIPFYNLDIFLALSFRICQQTCSGIQ